MIELKVGYFDSRDDAEDTDLSVYDEIYTLGFHAKNDGGGGHYKRYATAPVERTLGFKSTDNVNWGFVPDGGVVNPLQAGAYGDNETNDRRPLQDCIDFIKWWREASGVVTSHPAADDPVTPEFPFPERDSSQTAIKLVIPGNHTFVVDRFDSGEDEKGDGLNLTGPITIEGENRLTSRIRFIENTVGGDPEEELGGAVLPGEGQHGRGNSLFYTSLQLVDPVTQEPDPLSLAAVITGITFRNFTITGSYGPTPDGAIEEPDVDPQSNGDASLLTIYRFDNVLLENMVFEKNRAVMINGGQTRNFTMRGCLMSECRRGGLILTDADNVVVEDNDFRWVADDPVAITMGADAPVAPDLPNEPGSSGNTAYLAAGGHVRIVGNRSFGCRGLNVNGSKNVLIADNTHVLCRGRAIHVGCGTDQDKGDTTTLNVIVRNNIITDLLWAKVDPEQAQDQGQHRAIDIEMLQAAPNPIGTPGWPRSNGTILDPTQHHYTQGQGLQGGAVWQPGKSYGADDTVWWLGRLYKYASGSTSGTTPPTAETANVFDGGVYWNFVKRTTTPYSGNILVENNIISRSRAPAVHPLLSTGAPNPQHIDGFDNFASYGVGPWGGFPHDYSGPEFDPGEDVTVELHEITPDEGIAVSGSVRNLIIRGNQVRNCDTAILLYGKNIPVPFSLLDVTIEGNELLDWKTAGIRFVDYEHDYVGQGALVFSSQRVSLLRNRGDGDPFHWNEFTHVRMDNGKWADTRVDITIGTRTLSAGYGAFIDATNLGMVLIAGNHVRNVPQLVAGLNNRLHAMEGNVAYCNPKDTGNADVGYNVDHVGIGNLLAPQLGWRYVIEDGKPSSVTYGKLLNPCPLALNPDTSAGAGGKVPDTSSISTSRWVKGTIVANLKPTAITETSPPRTYEIWSWPRLTTGTTNGLDTDWRPLRVPAS